MEQRLAAISSLSHLRLLNLLLRLLSSTVLVQQAALLIAILRLATIMAQPLVLLLALLHPQQLLLILRCLRQVLLFISDDREHDDNDKGNDQQDAHHLELGDLDHRPLGLRHPLQQSLLLGLGLAQQLLLEGNRPEEFVPGVREQHREMIECGDGARLEVVQRHALGLLGQVVEGRDDDRVQHLLLRVRRRPELEIARPVVNQACKRDQRLDDADVHRLDARVHLRADPTRRQIVERIEYTRSNRNEEGRAVGLDERFDRVGVEVLDPRLFFKKLRIGNEQDPKVAGEDGDQLHLCQQLLLKRQRRERDEERQEHQQRDGDVLRQVGHGVDLAEEGQDRHNRPVNQHPVHKWTPWHRKRRVRVKSVIAELDAVNRPVNHRACHQNYRLREQYLVHLQALLLEAYLLAHVHESLHDAVDDHAGQPGEYPLSPIQNLIR